MPQVLTIHVNAIEQTRQEEFEFFSADEWTAETELLFFQKLQQLLAVLRPVAHTISLHIDAEVQDAPRAIFTIKKRYHDPQVLQTQKLSSREIEVISLVMQGLTNHEIADKLFISYETVRSHRKHILVKTGAKNTAALINYYHQTFFDKSSPGQP